MLPVQEQESQEIQSLPIKKQELEEDPLHPTELGRGDRSNFVPPLVGRSPF